MWWLDPQDAAALAIDDQFLLGDEVLVAPVLEEGAVTRHVYLPSGETLLSHHVSAARSRVSRDRDVAGREQRGGGHAHRASVAEGLQCAAICTAIFC